MEKKINLILILLFIIGLYLRVDGTLKGYFAFAFDQGRDFLQLQDFVYHHYVSLIGPPTGIDGVFHGVWWHWFLAPIFLLSQGNPTFIVATFNFLSTGIILLAFYLGKKISNDTLGVILSVLVSTSAFFVGTGAQLWHPNVVPLLILGLLISLWSFIKTRKTYFWVGFFLGAIFEFEVGFGLLFLPTFILTSVIVKLRPTLKQFFIGTIGLGIWLIPRIIFELRHHFLQTISFITFIQSPKNGSTPTTFIQRIGQRGNSFFNVFKDAFTFGKPLLAIIFLLLMGLTITYLLSSHKNKSLSIFIVFTLVLILNLFIITSFYPNALWDYYLIGLPPLILPLVGLVFLKLIEKFKFWGWVILGLWFMVMFAPWSLFTRPVWEGDPSVYKNQFQIVDTIFQDVGQESFNIQVYSPSVIDYTYHYLFNWRAPYYKRLPPDREHSQKLVFMIIEPDKWHPVLREAWLRDRVGDGTIVWKRNFSGGIEVEKRIR